jgi:predicted regulator of Ras-like GTPase activity (Roadblock/LC7/MglB family)
MILETRTQEAAPVAAVRDSPEDSLRKALQRFLRDLPEAQAVAIGDPNGLPVASLGRGPRASAAPAMETTAMATMALAAAQQVASSLHLAKAQEILIRTAGGLVIVQALGRGFSLSVVLSGEGNLGFAALTMQRLADEIQMILATLA